jgi:hypothetical protein
VISRGNISAITLRSEGQRLDNEAMSHVAEMLAFFFLDFPIYMQSVYIHKYNQQIVC